MVLQEKAKRKTTISLGKLAKSLDNWPTFDPRRAPGRLGAGRPGFEPGKRKRVEWHQDSCQMDVVVKTVQRDPILGVGEFTTHFRTYFSWDWLMVTGGYGILTHSHMGVSVVFPLVSIFQAYKGYHQMGKGAHKMGVFPLVSIFSNLPKGTAHRFPLKPDQKRRRPPHPKWRPKSGVPKMTARLFPKQPERTP